MDTNEERELNKHVCQNTLLYIYDYKIHTFLFTINRLKAMKDILVSVCVITHWCHFEFMMSVIS